MVEKITDFLLDISWFPGSVVQTLHGILHIDEYSAKKKTIDTRTDLFTCLVHPERGSKSLRP